jgi:hypothetical protein
MLIVWTCDYGYVEKDGIILLVNNSAEDIVWLIRADFTADDTITLGDELPWRNFEDNVIHSGTIYELPIVTSIQKDRLQDGWYLYYFFSYDTLLNVSWERIRDENIILKKVYFETWEDLEACNFTITYP